MKLTHAERLEPVWKKVAEHCQRRLIELRAKNDNTELPERETAVLRGRIAQLKEVLDLANDPPTVPGR